MNVSWALNELRKAKLVSPVLPTFFYFLCNILKGIYYIIFGNFSEEKEREMHALPRPSFDSFPLLISTFIHHLTFYFLFPPPGEECEKSVHHFSTIHSPMGKIINTILLISVFLFVIIAHIYSHRNTFAFLACVYNVNIARGHVKGFFNYFFKVLSMWRKIFFAVSCWYFFGLSRSCRKLWSCLSPKFCSGISTSYTPHLRFFLGVCDILIFDKFDCIIFGMFYGENIDWFFVTKIWCESHAYSIL